MNKDINFYIENYKCPFINAIFLGNGEILVLESLLEDSLQLRVLCKSNIDSFFDYNGDDYTIAFDILSTYEGEYYYAYAGEGSFGGDGVVYLKDKINNKLLWFLFLDNSNPFDTVEIKEDFVLVKSTNAFSLKIPILNPENISVVN